MIPITTEYATNLRSSRVHERMPAITLLLPPTTTVVARMRPVVMRAMEACCLTAIAMACAIKMRSQAARPHGV